MDKPRIGYKENNKSNEIRDVRKKNFIKENSTNTGTKGLKRCQLT